MGIKSDRYYVYSENVYTGKRNYFLNETGSPITYSWSGAYNEVNLQRRRCNLKGLDNITWHCEKV